MQFKRTPYIDGIVGSDRVFLYLKPLSCDVSKGVLVDFFVFLLLTFSFFLWIYIFCY